jgi:asparagine synthase (glutamine-hydrolysing)
MCGIFFVQKFLNKETIESYKSSLQYYLKYYQNDFYKLSSKKYHTMWGFHRLAINGQTPESNQPFFIKNCRLVCNGEIYNFRNLIKEFGLEEEYKSQSDCEIIIHLYKKIGIRDTLRRLDGVFALVLHDYDTETTYIARDPVGVRSLFISGYNYTYNNTMIVSSELKAISECFRPNAKQFPPGCYAMYSKSTTFDNANTPFFNFYSYYENVSITQNNATLEIERIYNYPVVEDNEENICTNIATLFEEAVVKRLMSDRKVGALLSGGLDSSSVVAIMCRHIPAKDLNTYSIGLFRNKSSRSMSYRGRVPGSN